MISFLSDSLRGSFRKASLAVVREFSVLQMATLRGDGMTLQSRFERFLGGPAAAGLPIPQLDTALGRKLLSRTEELTWLLNRYSLELNFLHGPWDVEAFLSFARDGGFDGVQLHITRSGPRMGLTAESDQYLAELAAQPGMRRLDITLDVSTIDRGDINDASRVARAMGVRGSRRRSASGIQSSRWRRS